MSQMEMPWPATELAERLHRDVLDEIRSVLNRVGRKEVVNDLSDWREGRMSASAVDNAAVDRDRHAFKLRQLLYLILVDKYDAILRRIAEAKGLKLDEERPLTDAERVARLERRLREKLGELGEETIKEAYRR